ncbi:Hypothetical predicted protein [Cloeon dipterum]|uniref:Uncharacterized protein n=1 Tax=Cloeon dipterum TaxID=197152 RepID=A0A8S1BKS5_9INSE|nr:Hypothetical predicted protein [Cloeon dipterum]
MNTDTEGLDRIRKQAFIKEEASKSMIKLSFSVIEQFNRISTEASDISTQMKEVQEKIDKNVITFNKEMAAFKGVTDAEMKMEDRDRKIESDFTHAAQSIENCKEEIEKLKNEMLQFDEVVKRKEKDSLAKVDSYRKIVKLLSEYTGVYWDFDSCRDGKLRGYVKCKSLSRIRPFELQLTEDKGKQAEELWSIIEDLNTK